MPAAPSSCAGFLAEPAEHRRRAALGVGVGAGAAGGVDLAAPVDVEGERLVGEELLGRRAAAVAGDVAGRHGDEVGRDAERRGSVRAMRVGPRRLTSTAGSSGLSKLTVAAEWMTMSHEASAARPASSRPRPSRPTSPATTCTRRVDERPRGRPCRACARGAGRRRRCRRSPVGAGARPTERLPGPDEEHDLAARHRPEQPLEHGGAEEPGRAGDEDPLAVEGLGDHGPLVYHLVDGRPDAATARVATARRAGYPPTSRARRRGSSRPPSTPSAGAGTGRPRSTTSPASLGVRKQTILYWFPSKEALLGACLDAAAVELAGELESALAGTADGMATRRGAAPAGVPAGGPPAGARRAAAGGRPPRPAGVDPARRAAGAARRPGAGVAGGGDGRRAPRPPRPRRRRPRRLLDAHGPGRRGRDPARPRHGDRPPRRSCGGSERSSGCCAARPRPPDRQRVSVAEAPSNRRLVALQRPGARARRRARRRASPDACPELRVHRDRREPGDRVELVDEPPPAALLVEEVDPGHAVDPQGPVGGEGEPLHLGDLARRSSGAGMRRSALSVRYLSS